MVRVSTSAVHAGEHRRKPYGAMTTPVVQTSTYIFADSAEVRSFMESKTAKDPNLREEYGRYGNPTQEAAERKIAVLEGAEACVLFASGMSAIATTLLALLKPGDHIVMIKELYRRSSELAEVFLQRWGIETTFVSVDEPAALDRAIRPETRVVFAEIPTNPHLRVVDLGHLVQAAAAYGVTTVVDSTFATPVNLRPLEFGVRLVIHSATKYLGGHNDLLAGAVAGSRQDLAPIVEARGLLGGVAGPHEAYLLLRGLKTLDLRVCKQNESAMRIAQSLQRHPRVARVWYPGLPGHPDHAVATRQMSGFGGVVSLEIAGDMAATARFVDRLRIPFIGPTLGGVESIVQQQAAFISLDATERRQSGIPDNLVRYAVGIEDCQDLLDDLEQALAER